MGGRQKLITVAVCTFERADDLHTLLDALEGQDLERSDFEVVVVDNGVEAATRSQPRTGRAAGVRYVTSSPPGLSRARNRALAVCETPLLAFVDDDAVPRPAWLSQVVACFDRFEQVGAVGGPIVPRWPSPRPPWLSPFLEATLPALDLGTATRLLRTGEYLYGANLAVRVEPFRHHGVRFDPSLGRVGPYALLSNEDLAAQDELRALGYEIAYAAQAVVEHPVDPSRATQRWLRRRLAWQAVSDVLMAAPTSDDVLGWRDELLAAASLAGLDTRALRDLFEDRDEPDDEDITFAASLELVLPLVRVLLSGGLPGRRSDRAGGLASTLGGGPGGGSGAAARPEFRVDQPVPGSTRHLFAEGVPAHEYLFDAYSRVGDAHLIGSDVDLYACSDDELTDWFAHLLRSATPLVHTLTLLSIEPLLRPHGVRLLAAAVDEPGLAVHGIVHRLPSQEREWDALTGLAELPVRLLCFSPDLARDLRRGAGRSLAVDPLVHHAVHHTLLDGSTLEARAVLGIPDDVVVLSVIGEARPGKGIDRLLDGLRRMPRHARSELFALVAGKASGYTRAEVTAELASLGVPHIVDLRGASPRQFKALTRHEYARYVSAADIGVQLHTGPERLGVSGALADHVASGSRIVASADSYVGELVGRHRLGAVVDSSDADATAAALCTTAEQVRGRVAPGPEYAAFREAVRPESAAAALRAVLDDGLRGDLDAEVRQP